MIAETFGEDVASIVEEVTDDKSLPKQTRKDEQIKTASKKSTRAKLLKLADKTSNLRAVAASPSVAAFAARFRNARARSVAHKGRNAGATADHFDCCARA